eukprot:CAMPEP_0174365876 /NCGR_PEP_ID=MMETSP0811_2-20130205/78910_1 /TAXON_ID=73025 ORGANISM="Eutreptiella gymnastica-like, Strain CCMP1594" /NCGR_SAMPLE_ID=MMETSP0811_2 /ASSEMBLY_ACC=CAM_ASM_000667 /LENGTH=40 /DNA_ID= /DNA_START= /DNA_END= /DNA_ORIENTATION=
MIPVPDPLLALSARSPAHSSGSSAMRFNRPMADVPDVSDA